MKKIFIALSAVVVLVAAVVIVVNAQDNKSRQKGQTEVTSQVKCCNKPADGTGSTANMPGCCNKSTASESKGDSTKCKMSGCCKSQPMTGNKSAATNGSQAGCSPSCKMKASDQK
ncbi:MAG TPA: hypothetical protein VMT63_06785 [Bacteroidales bacterium]|nr:hypothetical protein [Bacteroidales bacterium]